MTTDETYNGWTNRETWALALHVNNDYGLYHEVRDLVRRAYDQEYEEATAIRDREAFAHPAALNHAADQLREWFEEVRFQVFDAAANGKEIGGGLAMMVDEVGSDWRVDYREVAEGMLE